MSLSARALLASSIIMSLIGCFSTHLGPFESPPQLASLVEAAEIQMPLYVTDRLHEESRGFQFLCVVLPVSRVFPDDLSQLVTSAVTTHAGFAKYGMLPPPVGAKPTPRLEVEARDSSVHGYDLIVVRRPAASITLRGTLYTAAGAVRECETSASFSEFAKFAFTSDLENVLERATDQAAKQLVECLGLSEFSGFSNPSEVS